MTDELKNLFMKRKPSEAIALLGREQESYASVISTEVETTYSHTVRILHQFHEAGLVEAEKQGRKKIYTLTEKGEAIADAMNTLFDQLDTGKPGEGGRLEDVELG